MNDKIQVRFTETIAHAWEVSKQELIDNDVDPTDETEVMEYMQSRGEGLDFSDGEQIGQPEIEVTEFNSGE